VICDNALVTGFALGARPIDRHIVLEVCRDFEIAIANADPVVPVAEPATPEACEPAVGSQTEPAEITSSSLETDPVTEVPDGARRFAWFRAARAGARQ